MKCLKFLKRLKKLNNEKTFIRKSMLHCSLSSLEDEKLIEYMDSYDRFHTKYLAIFQMNPICMNMENHPKI